MSNVIIVERQLQKRQDSKLLLAQLKRIADISLKGSRGKGWVYSMSRIAEPVERAGDLVYTQKITYRTTSARQSLLKKWDAICLRFAEAGASVQYRPAWKVIEPKGWECKQELAVVHEHAPVTSAATPQEMAEELKELGTINLYPTPTFPRIYDRQPHCNLIYDALRLAQRTNLNKRVHSLLFGEPGCGKTEIMKAFRDMLGIEKRDWEWFDATSMTKAGVIEHLMKAKIVPPVLFIEEIEKCDENSLRWLLGVMDTRGEIRRTNYRVGNEGKNIRMIVISTANDIELLEKVMAGALYSRFQNKIWCPEPNRVIMRQVLEREVSEIDEGKIEWIEPAIKLGYDKWAITDPREVVKICLCGAERLKDGGYAKDFEATMSPKIIDRLKAKLAARKKEESRSDGLV